MKFVIDGKAILLNKKSSQYFYVRHPKFTQGYEPNWEDDRVIRFIGNLYTYLCDTIDLIICPPEIIFYVYGVGVKNFCGELKSGIILKVFDGNTSYDYCLRETLKDIDKIREWTATDAYRKLCENMEKLTAKETGSYSE